MDDDATQAAQQHADMLAYQRAARDALLASRERPLSQDEINLLAFFAGLET